MLQSRTFSVQLLSTYTPDAILEIAHFRDFVLDPGDTVAFYLDQANATLDLNSLNIGKAPELNGDESDVEKSLALTKAESNSNKIGLRFLTRKNNTGEWLEIAEFVLLNYGRKDYLDLRGRLGYPSRLLQSNDAIAVQLVDYGDGLLWDKDFINLFFGVTIDVSKKNDLTELSARIASLELALEGKLTNLPTNTLLGRNSANNGIVEAIPQTQFVEQIDLEPVILTHKNADDHTQYLNNSRGDARYVALTGNQSIAGNKTFSSTVITNGALAVSGTAGKCFFDHNGNSAARFQTWGPSTTSYGLYVFNQHYSDGTGGRNALVCNENGTWNIGSGTNTDNSLNTVNGSQRITGFTTLGDNIGIKCKRLTGVTASTQGGAVSVAHGLSANKIIGFNCVVNFAASQGILPGYTWSAGFQYDCNFNETSLSLLNFISNSGNILSKPFSVLVFYRA